MPTAPELIVIKKHWTPIQAYILQPINAKFIILFPRNNEKCDKWVPVTTAWHVLRLLMNGLRYGG